MPVTIYLSTQRNISVTLNDHECTLSPGKQVAHWSHSADCGRYVEPFRPTLWAWIWKWNVCVHFT